MAAQEEQLELCEHVVGRLYYVGRPTEHMTKKGRTRSGATQLCWSSCGQMKQIIIVIIIAVSLHLLSVGSFGGSRACSSSSRRFLLVAG